MNRMVFASSLVFSLMLMPFAVTVKAGSGPTLSAWAPSPPNINGALALGEWTAAATQTFTLYGSFAKIYVMNDANNLYLALEVVDIDPGEGGDELAVYFDNNHNGVQEKGENLFDFILSTGYLDGYWETDGFPGPNIWAFDTSDLPSGTKDGDGSAGSDVAKNYFEFSFPLDTADDAHDFSLSLGDIVGFTLGYVDNGQPASYWPASIIDTQEYGNILLASGSPKPVGGEVFQVDRLALLMPYITIAILLATAILIKKGVQEA